MTDATTAEAPADDAAIRVLVVDDQALIRAAVVALLAAEPDLEVAGEAADGAAAIDAARRIRPDVVLMDLRMPGVDGVEATRAITAGASPSRVLVLTTFEDEEHLLSALRAGASGFLGKGAEPDEIARAVRAVHRGDALLSPAATTALVRRAAATPRATAGPDLAALTEREREILELVGRGLSNDEIAERLVISPATAKTHVNRIMTKLGAHDRAQLVIAAYENGLVAPGE